MRWLQLILLLALASGRIESETYQSTYPDDMLREIKRTIYKHEGTEFTDDADDPGGATKFGISQRDHPGINVQFISLDEAVAIYIEKYWKPLNLDLIDSARVRFKIFDIGVNQGVIRAAMMVQRVCGTPVDGFLGPATAKVINQQNPDTLLLKLSFAQADRYAEIVARNPVMAKYVKGWIKRSHDLGEGIELEEEAI